MQPACARYVTCTLTAAELLVGLEQNDAKVVKIIRKPRLLGMGSVNTTVSLPSGPRFFTWPKKVTPQKGKRTKGFEHYGASGHI